MPKILIIEDEETIRRVLKKVLHQEDKNYEIIEAVDGVDGVSKINSNKFDLILCDIKMPKKDGIEVLRHVLKECPNTPTIMISSCIYNNSIKIKTNFLNFFNKFTLNV